MGWQPMSLNLTGWQPVPLQGNPGFRDENKFNIAFLGDIFIHITINSQSFKNHETQICLFFSRRTIHRFSRRF